MVASTKVLAIGMKWHNEFKGQLKWLLNIGIEGNGKVKTTPMYLAWATRWKHSVKFTN